MDSLPITGDELAALRARLLQPYQFEAVARDDVRYLFLRSPNEDPDPVSDLEGCLERVPDWAVRGLQGVFLLGARNSFHVPGTHVAPLLERRDQLDRGLVDEFRRSLDAQYGVGLRRLLGDPTNLVRLGLRIPRTHTADLSESDLVRMAAATGPLIESGEAAQVQVAYLVADEDHVRLRGDDFLADVTPRWQELQRPRPALPGPQPDPPATAPVTRRRPKRVLHVRPLVELEAQLDARPEAPQTTSSEAAEFLQRLLRLKDFQILRNVRHENVTYDLAAERSVGYPRRILVVFSERFERSDAERFLRAVRRLEADLLLVVAEQPAEDAIRRTLASKVKVLRPHEVAAVSL